jgi:hypothetical protein
MGLIAVFIALTGTAYAASGRTAPKNSVVTKSIKAGAVTHPKLAANSVDGSNVVDGSLTGADVNAGTLGTVPSATSAAHATTASEATSASHATSADSAAHASSADVATHATSADSAALATNSEQLGGSAASAYVKGSETVPGGQLAGTYAAPILRGSGSGTAGAQTLFAPETCSSSSTVSGPSVTVTVPASGFAEFLASAQFQTVTGNSLSACLVEDGGSAVTLMSSSSLTPETRYSQPNSTTGTTTAALAQWTPVFTMPGAHTFKLVFGRTGANSGTNQVSNRLLIVRALS